MSAVSTNPVVTAFRSELILLNRFRMWAIAVLTTVAFTVVATALLVTTAEPISTAGGDGIPLPALLGPGGATASVTWSFAFGFILLLAAFTSKIGNEFSRGTFRTALLHHHGRCSLIGGKMLALMSVTVVVLVIGMASGALTAAIVAPGQGIPTTGWFGAEAAGETFTDLVRMLGWAAGWALIGTTLAVIVRPTPIALGVGVLWFGPIENVIGEDRDLARRWFPGQLLRALVSPDTGDREVGAVSTGTATATLAAYAAVMIAAVAIVIRRRDVTA